MATLVADAEGNASVVPGQVANPDVTVAASNRLLSIALHLRDRSALPPGEVINVIHHTAKGRTAFEFPRGRLGL